MCGFAGFVELGGVPISSTEAILRKMGTALKHRGPDGSNTFIDQRTGFALVHQRLAIVDLSSAGNQPMVSADGRHVLALNGEIYNHLEIRTNLRRAGWEGKWRGNSDTETLLACIGFFGLEEALNQSIGMFALVLYDRRDGSVYIARDRMGEKPLYYGLQDKIWFFASELKAIRCHPKFRAEVSRGSLCSYMRHNYIPGPHSIYMNIKKLRPGTWLKLDDHEQEQEYWSFANLALGVNPAKENRTEKELLDDLDSIIVNAVQSQMYADVPVGAFLSGGVDSSLVVAMMQESSSAKVDTFSIGFEDKEFNEAPFAKQIACYLGTNHTEHYVTGAEARDVIPSLPLLYDEPFSDSSQIPTYLVSKIAKKQVTVSLSGDGGDELFAGYNRYRFTNRFGRHMGRLPSGLRRSIAKIVKSIPQETLTIFFAKLMWLLPADKRYMNIGDKLHKGADILSHNDIMSLYLDLISHWSAPEAVVLGGSEPKDLVELMETAKKLSSTTEQMMFLDSLTYLPDDILVKVDRAAMANSLETRVPFLDRRVVEAAWGLPVDFKIRNNESKWCLKELLYKRVPKHLIDRPKVGFGVPLGRWLRHELRDWSESLLDEKRLNEAGYFDVCKVRKKWEEHLAGKRNWQYHLWDVLMFESWRENVEAN